MIYLWYTLVTMCAALHSCLTHKNLLLLKLACPLTLLHQPVLFLFSWWLSLTSSTVMTRELCTENCTTLTLHARFLSHIAQFTERAWQWRQNCQELLVDLDRRTKLFFFLPPWTSYVKAVQVVWAWTILLCPESVHAANVNALGFTNWVIFSYSVNLYCILRRS